MSFIWRWRSSASGKLRSGLFQAKCYPHLTDLMQLLPCFSYFPLQRSAREVKINQSMEWTVCTAWMYYFYMEFFRSVYLFFSIVFFPIFTSVMRLFTRKKIPQLSVFVSGNWFLSQLVSDTLKLFSDDKSRNKRAGWYVRPSFVWSTSTPTEQVLSLSVLRMIIAVLCGKVSNKSFLKRPVNGVKCRSRFSL